MLWVLDGGLNKSLPSIYNVPLVSARLVRASCWRSIMSVFMALNGWYVLGSGWIDSCESSDEYKITLDTKYEGCDGTT